MTEIPETVPDAVPERAPRASRGRMVATAVLALVVVAAAVVLALFTSRASALDSVDSARRDALAAAQEGAANFTTYDYRHLDADFGRVRQTATGEFRTEFDKQAKVLEQLIKQGKAVAKGKVLDAAVVSATAHDATVLVALDDTITNTSAPKGVVRHYRLQIDMSLVGGRWLVSGVQYVA